MFTLECASHYPEALFTNVLCPSSVFYSYGESTLYSCSKHAKEHDEIIYCWNITIYFMYYHVLSISRYSFPIFIFFYFQPWTACLMLWKWNHFIMRIFIHSQKQLDLLSEWDKIRVHALSMNKKHFVRHVNRLHFCSVLTNYTSLHVAISFQQLKS